MTPDYHEIFCAGLRNISLSDKIERYQEMVHADVSGSDVGPNARRIDPRRRSRLCWRMLSRNIALRRRRSLIGTVFFALQGQFEGGTRLGEVFLQFQGIL